MPDRDANTNYRWAIRHETTYRYSTAVVFAPHVLRLTPRPDSTRTLARELTISPTPIEVRDFEDEFGNSCTRVSFGSSGVEELKIESRVEVETYARPAGLALGSSPLPPLPWAPPAYDSLAQFRQARGSAEIAALARRLASEVGGAALAFFGHLTTTLYAMIDRGIRVEGDAQTPEQTLLLGSGACRDLTVLYLAVCRTLGVAGRFVSGYQGREASPDGKRHLHAWPEVFVPELGWLAFDPTHGVPAGPGHVALCAAPEQAATMPVDGGFYFEGPTVTSTLGYSIHFDAL
ncbi:MAG TPA: transglutaminase family protein [Polyangiaceae bacterium]|nr:transglutaminase family protein [Polyangiaceae bacterium]HYQ28703.1 transglutaminase family protein [Polyangiaceae bacterium]